MTIRSVHFLFLPAALALLAGSSFAGPIIYSGTWKDGAFEPDKASRGPACSVRYSTIASEIEDGKAKVSIEEVVVRHAPEGINSVLLYPLPEGVVPESTELLAGTDDLSKLPNAKFLSAGEAGEVYEAIARGTESVALLALMDRPMIFCPGLSLAKKTTFKMQFSQKVREQDGLFAFACPLPDSTFGQEAVSRIALAATIRDKRPLRSLFSPSHEVKIERQGLFESQVRLSEDGYAGTGDFQLWYVADESQLGLRLLAHRAEGKEDGYFLLIGNPSGSVKPEQVIEKDVLFVLDTSGSMRGEKIEQASSAIEYCLQQLNDGDRFNIVTFGTEVKSFRAGPIEKTKKSLEAASVFIDEVVATGRTNISGALTRGLAGKRETKRPRIMIFLTDGSPTAGELVPEKIVENLSEMNESGTQIFVMGLGDDVNAHLLDGLSEGTNGSSEYVSPEEEIDVKVASLFNRLSNPVLTDIKISFGDLNTNSIYPQKLPALFKGSEIMVAGRYRDGGEHTVTISGTLGGKPVAHTLKAEFPAGVRGDDEFVATLWATRKIGYLLQEIRLHGENKELIDEVVHLSHKFGIVTEYTAFLATETRGFTQEEAAKEARKNISAANRQKAGKWAVSQACNDIDLQKRVRTGGQANSYIDRRGKVQTVQNIRQVGRRAFYLKEGQWEEADEQGDRKVRTVKLFSKEYFELLRNNPEFSKAQSIGWNLSVNVGNERIKVKK